MHLPESARGAVRSIAQAPSGFTIPEYEKTGGTTTKAAQASRNASGACRYASPTTTHVSLCHRDCRCMHAPAPPSDVRCLQSRLEQDMLDNAFVDRTQEVLSCLQRGAHTSSAMAFQWMSAAQGAATFLQVRTQPRLACTVMSFCLSRSGIATAVAHAAVCRSEHAAMHTIVWRANTGQRKRLEDRRAGLYHFQG